MAGTSKKNRSRTARNFYFHQIRIIWSDMLGSIPVEKWKIYKSESKLREIATRLIKRCLFATSLNGRSRDDARSFYKKKKKNTRRLGVYYRVNEIKIGGVIYQYPFWRRKTEAFRVEKLNRAWKVDVPCGWIELLAIKKLVEISFPPSPFTNVIALSRIFEARLSTRQRHTCLTRRAGLQIVDSYLHFNNSSLLPCHSRSLSTTTRQPRCTFTRTPRAFPSYFILSFFRRIINTRVCAYTCINALVALLKERREKEKRKNNR